jgi:hypothetical protein
MNKRIAIAGIGLACLAAGVSSNQVSASATGTWEAYPGQQAVYQTSVQPPINADGSSNFKANGKAVIPVKLGLSAGSTPFLFESIGSDSSTTNDYSFVSFTPATPITFNEITVLSAKYLFTIGDCQGGSLRWSVRTSATQSVSIYYGKHPQFGNGGVNGCKPDSTEGVDQSGENLIGLADLRYDTSQYPGGTFYDTYAHTQTLIGTTPIIRASLVLDSGWGGDQRLKLTSATFATAGFTDTFVPSSNSSFTATCPTLQASVFVTKMDAVPTGSVNEADTIQPQDDNGLFRIVDCKYMYNLATSSLSGVGTYNVYAKINGVPASNPAVFDLK